MKARIQGNYKGRRVWRFPVEVTFGETAARFQVNYYPKGVVWVIALSAQDAADLVSGELESIPCVEVTVCGPRGGRGAHRYWGWDRAIWAQMLAERERTCEFGF